MSLADVFLEIKKFKYMNILKDIRFLKTLVKIFATCIIIFFLVDFNVVNFSEISNVSSNISFILYAIIFMILTIPLASFRWWLLLKSESYNISYKDTFLLYYTGLFFNIFMPGSAGGDLTKGYYLFKHVEKKQRSLAIFSIFVDRLIGLHSMLFLISILGFIIFGKIYINNDLNEIFIIIVLFMIFSVPLTFILINLSNKLIEIMRNKNQSKTNLLLIKFFQSMKIYSNRKNLIFKCWVISIFSNLFLLSCFYLIVISMNINIFSYIEATFIGGVSMVSNVLPVTPGGIGIGESTFNYLSKFIYDESEIAFGSIFFVTIRVLFNFVCLIGAITFILIKEPSSSYKRIRANINK